MRKRIYLSPPHLGGDEFRFVKDTFDSNFIAPVGPQIDCFEDEFAKTVNSGFAAAVSSGTAAQQLLLRYLGVSEGDEVFCSSFTFVATANAISYLGARPVFIDSDEASWNMDPHLLRDELSRRAASGMLPKAIVVVHLYGIAADLDPILEIADTYGIAVIEDAAESLGTLYKGKNTGTLAKAGFFSFNGNKIITTSGGGMVVSEDRAVIDKVKFWATQARDDAPHYEHSEIGYNYRMSNILAAIGRGQLRVLQDRVEKKRGIFAFYKRALGALPGLQFMPSPKWSYSSHWLTCITIDPAISGCDCGAVMEALEKNNIESRPTWKPMHLQPLYRGFEVVGGGVSEYLFNNGLCLPSGTAMSDEDMDLIVSIIKKCWH